MSGLRKSVLTVAASMVLLMAGAGVAGANDDPGNPLDPVVKSLTSAAQQATGQQGGSAGSQGSGSQGSQTPVAGTPSPAVPSSPSTSTNNGISEPKAPDHASSHVLHGELLPGQLPSSAPPATADAGSSSSTINDDGTSNADASLLAIGGMTVYGSQASSGGSNDAHGPADPVCAGSSGAVCPLVADSHATETSTASDSSSKTSAASICLTPPAAFPIPLPAGTTAATGCPTGLGLGALSSQSSMHRDKTTGETSGQTSSSLASACIPGAPGNGCVGLVTSSGTADSNGGVSRSSSIASFFGMATPLDGPQAVPDQLCHPAKLPVLTLPVNPPAGFPTLTPPTTGLCGYVNQGQTFLSSGFAAVSQTALGGDLLGLASFDAGHSEVRVHQADCTCGTTVVQPPTTVTQPPAVAAPVVHHAVAEPASDTGGILPHTGGIWSGWLAIALLMLSAGSALAARDLRRGRASAA